MLMRHKASPIFAMRVASLLSACFLGAFVLPHTFSEFRGISSTVLVVLGCLMLVLGIGNVMFGKRRDDGEWSWPHLDLVRLAIPRRVYTKSQIDYVSEGLGELFEQRERIRGMRFVERPDVLPHFTARFEPLLAGVEAVEVAPTVLPADAGAGRSTRRSGDGRRAAFRRPDGRDGGSPASGGSRPPASGRCAGRR